MVHRLALVARGCELAAVVVVGSLTLDDPRRWGDLTVWSAYGESYGLIPVILPLLGLAFLWASAALSHPS